MRKDNLAYLGPTIISLAAYGGLLGLHLRYGTLREGHVPETLAWLGLAFAGYLALLWGSERAGRLHWAWLWLPPLLFRLLLLFTTPTLSDDVYRYLWDGYIANGGVSPYAFATNAPELDSLAIPLRALINHPGMASPYLPGSQWLFAIVAHLLPLRPLSMQVAMVAADLGCALLIARLLRQAHLPARRLALYLWHPLVIVEVAHGAHMDAWMMLLALLAVWASLDTRDRLGSRRSNIQSLVSPILLALATLTKLLPALFLPVLVWRWRWRGLLVYTGTLAAILLPTGLSAGWGLNGPLDGRGLFGALRLYVAQWHFNSGLYHWLREGLEQLGVAASGRWAMITAGVIMLAVLVHVWRHANPERFDHSSRSCLRRLAAPYAAYILLTTTVHPWYLLGLLLFLPFLAPGEEEPRRRWLLLAPWLWLSAAVMFSYLTYLDPTDFRELAWVRRLEWLPTLVLLGLAWQRQRFQLRPLFHNTGITSG